MRALAVIAAVLLAAASLLPAEAHGRSLTVNVQVTTGPPAYQPVAGAEVEIVDMQGNPLGNGVTDADGKARIKVELPEGANEIVVGADAQGSGSGNAYSVLDLHYVVDRLGIGLLTGPTPKGGPALLVLVKRAIAKCDKAEYDRWVAELDRLIAKLEQDLGADQAAADGHAQRNDLRNTDLKGARKDLDRAEKAQSQIEDAGLRNPAMLAALEDYIELLAEVERTKEYLDATRKALEAVPPFPEDCKKEDDKFGMAPGTGQCPDGSGGLLAGALNDIFGTDLAGACADPSRRRDTDRPRKDRERHGDRKD